MKKKLIPIFLCLNVIFLAGFVTSLKGQKGECLTDIRMELAQPMLKGSIDSSLLKFATREVKTRTQKSTTIIPVHVVVVHTPRQQVGTEDNISADVIRDQIAVLNRDFNRYNLDSTKTPDSFSTGGLDIYFCLAQIDPFGVSTEGITRYSSSLPFTANEFAIKEATGWPRSDYLNIYVTKLEDGNFGYSYIPSTTSLPDEILDGVVINVKNFGGSENTYNAGRTLVHEVGHFLGLKHIWGEDGCDNDDGITDTPPQDTANVGCPVHPKLSCSNLGDMFMN
ncbi:MAG TPA: M43 family zinc metalloprotease, partial [Saprospiraceae bacterium]|nr:M43 family zinc metalloprotease [Saprospiraceae bacterium]